MTTFSQTTERYPAFVATISLCLGILVAHWIDGASWGLRIGLVITASIVTPAMLWQDKRFLWSAVAIIFFVLGLNVATRELWEGRDFEPSNASVCVQATVAKTWSTGPDFRILLVGSGIESESDRPLPGLGRLFTRNDSLPLLAGDRVAFRSRIRKPVNRGNPGEFDWELDCRNNGICWLASVKGPGSLLVLRRGSPYDPRAVMFRIRDTMTRFLDTNSARFLDDEARVNVRAVQKGIILGDMGEISPALNKSWAESGIAHALSASGVHIAIVALLSLFLVKSAGYAAPQIFLRVPFRKLGALASVPAMVLYCVLVGARVPAIRSTIMGLVVAAAILLDRRWNSLNSLVVSALIILLIYPLSLFTPSFQLSFLAVAGILMVFGNVRRHVYGHNNRAVEGPTPGPNIKNESAFGAKLATVKRALTILIVTSLAATLAIAPLILQYFHSFPVYTLFANLVTDFAMTLALSLGLSASTIGCVWPMLGSILLAPSDILVWTINKTADFFSGLPWSTVRLAHMGVMEFILISGSAWTFLWYLGKPSRKVLLSFAAVLSGTVIFLGFSTWITDNKTGLKVVFLNVGKGDAIFVKPPSSKGLLIDGGVYTNQFDAGRSIVLPFLDWTGASTLNAVIMTHPDMDHMGGLLSVVQRIPSLRFLWNPVQANVFHLEKILSATQISGARVESVSRESEPIALGCAVLTFLNKAFPSYQDSHSRYNVNNYSVVCRLDHGQSSFLFTGDLQREGEQELLESGLPLKATVLKVAHHAGNTGTTRRFVEAVRPDIAVISAEHPPVRGLPNMDVINRLECAGTRILWTGRDGAITIESDGVMLRNVALGKRHKSSGEPVF